MNTTKWTIGAALLTLSAGAVAGDATGTYMTFVRSASETSLPDGNRARVMHFYHAGTSDQATSPFAGRTSECVGRMILTSAGKVVSGSGYCFAQDAKGGGGAWTWKVEQAGTDKCPTVCGMLTWLESYGNAGKAPARGTWRQTGSSTEGSIGTYTVTFKP